MAETLKRRVLWRLDALKPEWVSAKDRWGLGVSWACPLHEHRLTLLFRNALDGGKGPGKSLRWGSSFSTLSVLDRVEMPPCFDGWIDAGELVAGAVEH